ncbi:MAG: bifunctional folylpolyglutamate synthase/dihydrofolate synthase [Bifidobacteriaceae bacterium]|nr:bifunctional folylpolyglutamate synthase/dihydrofolate synthase [Bifidobacteriaceae bacterium]
MTATAHGTGKTASGAPKADRAGKKAAAAERRAAKRTAEDAQMAERAQQIYRDMLGRAPEHDFDPKLDRVQQVLDLLGGPQHDYEVVHVAGTNGKTSTTRMIASLLAARGLRVGFTTSPHLTSVRERIQIDGRPISPADFVATWAEVEPIIDLVDAKSVAEGGPKLSFFECMIVMAFVAFSNAPVDVAVVEVGMGGRWDATNVVDSQVQVIMPISRDHERWLGHDLASIAGEKAGILRAGGRAVISAQAPEAAGVFEDKLAALESDAVWQDRDFGVETRTPGVGGQLLTLRGPSGAIYTDVFLPLFGAYQAQNAACALAAVEEFFAPEEGPVALPAAMVEEGFGKASSPGRMEIGRRSPLVLIDAAHNVAGAEALVAGVRESFPMKLIGVVGILGDKDAEGILGLLEPVLDRVVITRSSSPRAIEPEELAVIARDVFGEDRVEVVERLDDALARGMEIAEIQGGDDPAPIAPAVLAAGSVTIAAEVRILLGIGGDL